MRRGATQFILAIVTYLLVAWLLLPRANWDGAVAREVRLHAVDAHGLPLVGANVTFNGLVVGVTDASGNANWTTLFGAGGDINPFVRGHWLIDGEILLTDSSNRTSNHQLSTLVRNARPTLWNKGPLQVAVTHRP